MSGSPVSNSLKRRKTRRRYEIEHHARFLTFSCFHRLPLFKNDLIKARFVRRLAQTRQVRGFLLHAWVIMPEHAHLLLTLRLSGPGMAPVLSGLKRTFASEVLSRWRAINAPILKKLNDSRGLSHFWQVGGGYDRNIFTSDEYFEKIRYIHHNPVERRLVERPTEWAWSSERAYLGGGEPLIPIDHAHGARCGAMFTAAPPKRRGTAVAPHVTLHPSFRVFSNLPPLPPG